MKKPKKTKKTKNLKRKSKQSRKTPINKTSQREKMLKRHILTEMSAHKNKAYSVKELTEATGLWEEVNNNELRSLLHKLAEAGKLVYMEKGKYKYADKKSTKVLAGSIEITRGGTGFLLQEGEDIMIKPDNLGKAMNGDTVKIKLLRTRKKSSRREGIVLEILARNKTQFVGTLEGSSHGSYFLVPDDPKMHVDLVISKDKVNGGRIGEKVLVRMLEWEGRLPRAEVLEVLGMPGENETEMHAILLQYGFDPKFPKAVEVEAEQIPEKLPVKEIKKRRDMRNIPTITIDPIDAKDFDDALSVQLLENGHIEVGVHIADVSYYVRPGTLLDKEAFHRGTSVYLVDRTVPMLPEKLSNRLCSLRPHEDKFTFSAIFELDNEGKIHKEWFGRTVIHSDYRFHYEEAQAVLEGDHNNEWFAPLTKLNQLAYKLRDERTKAGSIEFRTEEVKFKLDENGKPIGVFKKERKDAHRLIEDFMLLANRRVARFVNQMSKHPVLPFVYRVHDTPDPEKLLALKDFAKHFGHAAKFESSKNPAAPLNALLTNIQGLPEQNVIETLAIRSMAKAIYSVNNIGHFGLGFQFYSHFTSPIRRYPDLLVHRILDSYLSKQFREDPNVLQEQCKHCSNKEKTAAEAERASVKFKQVEFLSDKIGERYPGIISGLIESGFFVELDGMLCEGFVPIRSLEDDFYMHDPEMYRFVGNSLSKIFQLGDKVEVEILETDLHKRQIEFALVEKVTV